MLGSVGSGRTAFDASAAIFPGVSAPSRVVRSIIRIARSSAKSFASRLIDRRASVAARSSTATASTEPTRGSRGISGNLDLYQGFDQVRHGQLARRNVAIILEDAVHQPIRRWLVHNAWPARYAGPVLDGRGNEVVIEEVELAHDGIEIDAEGG